MATAKTSSKKVVLTRKRATLAAKRAQKRYKAQSGKKTAAWQKGGKQWSRVLGHFGMSA
jgi:hypothetical protein